MTVTTLASGSSGNCCLVSQGDTYILVDAGISCRRVTRSLAGLGLAPEQLSGVLITHEHSDHISGLATLFRRCAPPVWCSAGTARHLATKIDGIARELHIVCPGSPFVLGGLTVSAFPTLHDAAESLGFTLSAQGHKAAVVTDLGRVTPDVLQALEGAELLLAEANHDPEMLRRGPYPPSLQARISGQYGHLSNAACAQMCAQVRPKTVLLAHLSEKNNDPALALQTVQAGVGPGVHVEVAPRNEPGRRCPVE
ncbi:MAG: MBL fold metallo-hydrolase [Oscillospiraceae bacterium]|nr:MBL fold metallo-hydrolase [Oscillospiraceae bacterium]